MSLTYDNLEAFAYTLTWLERESEVPDGYSIVRVEIVHDESGERVEIAPNADGHLAVERVVPKSKPIEFGPLTFHSYRPAYF